MIHSKTTKKWLGTAMLVLVFFGLTLCISPEKSRAQAGAASSAVAVPISTGFDFNTTMKHLKDFVLDHLATLMAKQILHQMTISVVNWINSGFNGSPAFITNPQAFFLDAADQITGAFIASDGLLSSLCSPFNLDIRLSLALGQSSLTNQRYSCTLSTIIQNAKNAHASISVGSSPNGANLGDLISGNVLNNSNQLSINGASVNDVQSFMDGDFSQGGWPAFMAMVTKPQNNPNGAYLVAESDLQSKIIAKHSSINNDLNRGNGFLSWQKCDDLVTIDPSNPTIDDYNYVQEYEAGGFSRKQNSDGTVTYQDCQTQTPGSVISGSLQKQLNVPADELELANDINAVIDALVSQLVTQVLNNGLASVSANTGGHVSFTSQIQANSVSVYNQQVQSAQVQANSAANEAQSSVKQYKDLYDQAVTLITDSQSRYQKAAACFTSKVNSSPNLQNYQKSYAETSIQGINTVLNGDLQPYLIKLMGKQADAQKTLDNVNGAYNASSAQFGKTQDVYGQTSTYSDSVQASINANANATNNMGQAQQDLDDAKVHAQTYNQDSANYQSNCDAFPGIVNDLNNRKFGI